MGLLLQHARKEIALGSDEHSQEKQGSTAGTGGCASMAGTCVYQNWFVGGRILAHMKWKANANRVSRESHRILNLCFDNAKRILLHEQVPEHWGYGHRTTRWHEKGDCTPSWRHKSLFQGPAAFKLMQKHCDTIAYHTTSGFFYQTEIISTRISAC